MFFLDSSCNDNALRAIELILSGQDMVILQGRNRHQGNRRNQRQQARNRVTTIKVSKITKSGIVNHSSLEITINLMADISIKENTTEFI